MTQPTLPPNFHAIRDNTILEGIRILLVQALYGKDDPTISWEQLINCAQNIRHRAERAEAEVLRLKGAA